MAEFNAQAQALEGVRDLSPYQPGKPIEELERELGLKHIVKLASNENPLGYPKAVDAFLQKPMELSRYPDGSGYRLKKSIAEKLSDNTVSIEPNQVTLGNGSNDVLDMIARVFAAKGDEIIMSQYAFAVYYLAAKSVGATPVMVPAKEYGHDLDAMVSCITEKTKIIYIANPNNPTGNHVSASSLRDMLARVPEHVLVVIDEAYAEYVDAPDYESMLGDMPQYDNLIITRTFSKIYGIAGLRVGYSISSPSIADFLNRVRHPFNLNCLALEAACLCLKDTDFVSKTRALNNDQKHKLYGVFDELGLDYIASAGNFICVDFGDKAKIIDQMLLQKGVIVRPLQGYQMPHHLRISIGLESENDFFVVQLKACLDELNNESISE